MQWRRVGWLRPAAAMVMLLALSGCGADVLGLTDIITDPGSGTSSANDLIGTWRVLSYSGTTVGAVTVSSAANMAWKFTAGAAFTVTSAQALSIGNNTTKTYDVQGTWVVTDTKGQKVGLTVLRDGTTSIDAANWVQKIATYAFSGGQMVLTTDAIGPGTVRYVLQK